jgi:hypothetical protein
MRRFPDQSGEIQNQAHPAIPKNGATGNSGDILESLAEAFDHGLLLTDEFVDHQTETAALPFGHD